MWVVDYSTNAVTLPHLSFLDHSFQFSVVKQRNACDHCPIYSLPCSCLKNPRRTSFETQKQGPNFKDGDTNLLFWPIFPKNCVQMTKKWTERSMALVLHINNFSWIHSHSHGNMESTAGKTTCFLGNELL